MATSTAKVSSKVKVRCGWAGDDGTYVAYHDSEWGVPIYDDQQLFEFLILEGAQAGLSWITILRKRDAYRKAFADFDPEKVARFNAKKIESLMQDAGIVRKPPQARVRGQKRARVPENSKTSSAASATTSGPSSTANPSKTAAPR